VQPLMVLFEDLHWIDTETQALLDILVESVPTARLLLLVNYRPEYQHGWGSKTYYRQLHIDPLPAESAEALLELAFTRARQLCEQIGDPGEMFQALWGLWLLWTMQGKIERGRHLGEELLVLAQRSGDQALLLEAHHALWVTLCWVGDPTASREHIEAGMALYDREQHRSHAFFYGGHDPGVCCRVFSGIALWTLGYPAKALEDTNAGLALAEELSHPFSSALAHVWACMAHQFRGEVEVTRERAKVAIALSTEHGFPQWLATGMIFDGWARAEQGEAEAGIAQLRRGLAELRATGADVMSPVFPVPAGGPVFETGQDGRGTERHRGSHERERGAWTASVGRGDVSPQG
jgi:predicted ATPase